MLAPPDDFAQHVRHAAARPNVRAAVGSLYDRVQSAIDARKPRCDISGRCCRFEQFGHRLFVTTIEMAAFLHDLAARGRPAAATWDGVGCPFQANKLCGVHAFRPFGCRMFFCDPAAADWQNDAYERFHADLKALHGFLDVPYAYVEWRAALRAVGVAQRSCGGETPGPPVIPGRGSPRDRDGGAGPLPIATRGLPPAAIKHPW